MQFQKVFLVMCFIYKFSHGQYTTVLTYDGVSQSSNPFIWSVNLPYLKVNVTFVSTSGAGGSVTFNLSLTNGTAFSCESLFFPSTCGSCMPEPNKFTVTKISKFSCQYTILINDLTSEYNNTSLVVEADSSLGFDEYVPQIILVKECPSSIVNRFNQTITVLPSAGLADFDSVGNCSCPNSGEKIFHSNGLPYKDNAKCKVSPQWDGCFDAQCWYAPTNVSVLQQNHYVGNPANLNCTYKQGFPVAKDINYTIENVPVESDIILKSVNHNKAFQCQPDTKYTRQEPTSGSSQPGNLIVYFGPEIINYTATAEIEIGGSGHVFIYLRANDRNKNISSHFSRNDQTFNASTDVNDIYYNFSYVININSTSDYGTYVFRAQTFDPNNSTEVNISVRNKSVNVGLGSTKYDFSTTISSYTNDNLQHGIKTETIIIICAAIVGAVIILIVMTLLVRRYRNNRLVKEDKINPIYATSSVDNTASTKEDRVNPLYGTTGGSGHESEVIDKEEKLNPLYDATVVVGVSTMSDEYAEVKKEPAIKGKDNPGFSIAQTSDTYAEVMKVKKGKHDMIQTSGPEVLYAEVKKDKEMKDASLHGDGNKAP